MGIRDTGYRHWKGEYTGHGMRWWTIAKQGIRATIYNKLRLAFLLIFAAAIWFPFGVAGIISYVAGPAEAHFECGEPLRFAGSTVRPDPDHALRCNHWDLLRGWQFLVVPLFIAMVATPLVSGDLRSNAMYIYLSKPMERRDYILGKLTAVAVWGLVVTVLPNVFMWLMVLSSTRIDAQLSDPYEILGEVLLVQVVFLALLTLLTLAVSSFTKSWQTAFIAFLGAWFGPWLIANLIVEAVRARDWYYISIINNVNNFAETLYDIPAKPPDFAPSLLIVLGLLVAGFVVFLWRILKLEVAE